MTMTQTRAQTATAAATTVYERILYVTRKLQADLLGIVETYGCWNEAYARDVVADLRTLLDEDALAQIEFHWRERAGARVLQAIRYEVRSELATHDDARSGGIAYRAELRDAAFNVRVTYNARWDAMAEAERAKVRARLKVKWGPGETLDYGGGQWGDGRAYAKDGYALDRRSFGR